VKSIIFFVGIGGFLVCLTFQENAGMPENYRLMMDYEFQVKKSEKSTS
jgi:hypothetical protein